jgi:hypothetical protein
MTYGRVKEQLHIFLTQALVDGGNWSASPCSDFLSVKRTDSTHWLGGWVAPIADLNKVARRKLPISSPQAITILSYPGSKYLK